MIVLRDWKAFERTMLGAGGAASASGHGAGVISFRAASSAYDSGGNGQASIGTTLNAGDLIFVMGENRIFSAGAITLLSGYTSIATTADSSNETLFAYKVAAGGETDFGSGFTKADFLVWSIYAKTGGTWSLGTNVTTNNSSTSCIYAGCSPSGSQWVTTLNMNGGNFAWSTLTTGTNHTSRHAASLNDGTQCQVRVWDSAGVATTWPGDTITSVGSSRWISNAIPFSLV